MSRPLRTLYLSLYLLLSTAVTWAQVTYTVSGKVLDAANDEPLPFVNVYLQGKTIGTTTDIDGNYTIETSQLSDSLVCSSIGYNAGTRVLYNKPVQTVNFILERASIGLQEVIINPGENPAHPILKKVIENKEKNDSRKSLKNHSYEAYTRVELDMYDWGEKFEERKYMKPFQFVFDNVDSTSEEDPYLPIFFVETLSDYYYRSEPKGKKEEIKAGKQSGMKNESINQFTGSLYQEVNFYDNWPELFFKHFVSPISDNGLAYYRYYLVDSGYVENKWCYKLNFIPKGKGYYTFVGDMWIADSTFALQKMSLEMAAHVNINYVKRVGIYQLYTHIQDSIWMMKKDKIVVKFKPLENTPGIIGRKTANYKDFVVNSPLVEEKFDGGNDIEIKEDIFDKSDQYWEENRHEGLTGQEVGVYEMVDSLMNTKVFRTWLNVFQAAYTGYYEKGWFEYGSVWSLYSTNDIEEHRFRMGIGTSDQISKRFYVRGYAAYGLKDERFKYGGEGLFLFKKWPRRSLRMEYMKDLDLAATDETDIGQANLLVGWIRRDVPQKLNFLDKVATEYFMEWPIGFSNSLRLQHYDLTPQFGYRYLTPASDGPPDTLSTFTTSEIVIKTRFAYREKFVSGDFTRVSLGSSKPILSLKYTMGVKDVWNSQFTYHRLDFQIHDNFPINPIGQFNYDLFVGKIFNRLPFFFLEAHPGNETYFFNEFAFNLMNEYEFISDTYAAIILSHHFNGFFFDKVPAFRKLKWRSLIMGKAVMGEMTPENREANSLYPFIVPNKTPYVEAGVGIENILRLFRVDAIWRLTYRDQRQIANFGVRAGLQIMF